MIALTVVSALLTAAVCLLFLAVGHLHNEVKRLDRRQAALLVGMEWFADQPRKGGAATLTAKVLAADARQRSN